MVAAPRRTDGEQDEGDVEDLAWSKNEASSDYFLRRRSPPLRGLEHQGRPVQRTSCRGSRCSGGAHHRDGANDNNSWNCGAEGPTDDTNINETRVRQMRNMIATMLLSQGVPMLLAGDELGHHPEVQPGPVGHHTVVPGDKT